MIVPRVFESAITARLAELHDLTVDHRPRPGGEINEDRIRFAGTASRPGRRGLRRPLPRRLVHLRRDPGVRGRLPLRLRADRLRVRLHGAGAQRQRGVGQLLAAPGPAAAARDRPGLPPRPGRLQPRHDRLPRRPPLRAAPARGRRPRDRRRRGPRPGPGSRRARPRVPAAAPGEDAEPSSAPGTAPREEGKTPLPDDRFFVTSPPLESSEADIERGVISNLAALDDLSTGDARRPRWPWWSTPGPTSTRCASPPELGGATATRPSGPGCASRSGTSRRTANVCRIPVLSALPAFENVGRVPPVPEGRPPLERGRGEADGRDRGPVGRGVGPHPLPRPSRVAAPASTPRTSPARSDFGARTPSHGPHERNAWGVRLTGSPAFSIFVHYPPAEGP